MEIIQKTKQTQIQHKNKNMSAYILSFSIIPDSFRSENAEKLRDNEKHQRNKLLELVDGDTFDRINELVKNFQNKNRGLSVIKARFYRALRILLQDSERNSRVVDGKNINYTIKQYLHNLDEKSISISDRVIDYQKKENNLGNGNVKWRKSPFSRILVIAILLGLKIYNDNTVTINKHKYYFSKDFDGLLKKEITTVSCGSLSQLSLAETVNTEKSLSTTYKEDNSNISVLDNNNSKDSNSLLKKEITTVSGGSLSRSSSAETVITTHTPLFNEGDPLSK